MLDRFSSSNNDSLFFPQSSNENTSIQLFQICYMFRPNSFIITAILLAKITILLPLSITVLHHGLQEWRKRPSTSSAAPGHNNTFTYHLVIMELLGVLGNVLFICGINIVDVIIIFCGLVLINFTWYGEMFFHILTCVERYLAVVHPFIYLSLKNERGVRIRNISTGCVWLLCILVLSQRIIFYEVIFIDICLLSLSLSVIYFCNLSVLCALIHPVPGDQGEDRVDQSKKKAFLIILFILVLLSLRFAGDLVQAILPLAEHKFDCVQIICDICLQLPNSLVLPLLFLQQAGKCVCFNTSKG